jgi:hypothetical protein
MRNKLILSMMLGLGFVCGPGDGTGSGHNLGREQTSSLEVLLDKSDNAHKIFLELSQTDDVAVYDVTTFEPCQHDESSCLDNFVNSLITVCFYSEPILVDLTGILNLFSSLFICSAFPTETDQTIDSAILMTQIGGKSINYLKLAQQATLL